MILGTLAFLKMAPCVLQRGLGVGHGVFGFSDGLVVEVLGTNQGHVAFEVAGSPGVLALEEGDDFLLR